VPHPTAAKVQQRLRERGLDIEVRELAESTRTVGDAAAAVGVETGQIVKSLVFTSPAGAHALVLCAGDQRVDTSVLGDGWRTATASEVRTATGFSIGGVPPLGHDRQLRTIIDASLSRFDSVWCAAGTPNAVFQVETDDLLAAIPDADVRRVSVGVDG
jgi:prolyl-tRNA editing enzyme YbaK/EbsC (Cys-tRNA(Pro) deacylase)